MSFPDPLGLFSSSNSRLSLPPPGQLFQALRSGFAGQMQAMPQQQAQSMFPNANLGGTPAQNMSTGPSATPAAATPQTSAGSLPTITLPGGVTLPPPPTPFAGNAASNAAPNAQFGMPLASGTTGPATGPSGLLGTANSALGTVANTLRNVLAPPAPTPVPTPTSVPGPTSGTAQGPVGMPANVGNVASQVAGTVGNAVNSLATPDTTPRTMSLPAGPTSQPAQTAPTAPAVQQSTAASPQAAPGAATMQATAPNPAMVMQQASATATPQQALGAPATASPTAPTQAAAPHNAQVPGASTGPSSQQPATNAPLQQAPVVMQAPAVPATPQGTPLLAAVPLAATVAQVNVAPQVAGNPQAQPVGNPLAGNAALDAGSPVRAELTGTGTYTAEGPGLRRRERMRVGAQQMGQWMLAMAQGRLHLVRPHDDSRHEAERVFQWLFWVLAIVAYGCLGLVLVAFLLSFGELPVAPTLRRWTGEFAVSGLLAAGGAWWLGRQLTRATRGPDEAIRR